MRRLRLIIIIIFLLGLTVVTVTFNTSKQRILILQSYDKDYAWTRDVDIGIRRILNKKGDYIMRWFYMDTKRHPWEHYKINSGLAVQKLINSWHPAVVIAVDDDAQEFAMRFFNGRKDVRVVFAGVNNRVEDYGYDKADNVTGILERLPLTALKETILEIAEKWQLKRPIRIMFLGDRSTTVQGDEDFFSSFDWSPIHRVESKLVETYAEWQAAVLAAKKNTDFIIVSNYRQILRDKTDTVLVPPAELIKWTEQNSIPLVIGTNVFYASDGGMLAIGTSPYEQGEVAAIMARDLLSYHNKSARSIPIAITRQFVVAERADRLRARNIHLSSVYEAAARAANNYYEDDTQTTATPAAVLATATHVHTTLKPTAMSGSISTTDYRIKAAPKKTKKAKKSHNTRK